MAYETYSLFDSLEFDQTQQRVASRRALALAETRVSNKMGQFLRGARSEEEFLERLGLLQEDFDFLVTSAAEEVGYENANYIKTALVEHYASMAKAADQVKFEETPEEEAEEEQKEASAKQANPNFLDPNANPNAQVAQPQLGQPSLAPMVTPFSNPSASPLAANPAAQVNQNVPQPGIPQIPGADPNNLEQHIEQPQMITGAVTDLDQYINASTLSQMAQALYGEQGNQAVGNPHMLLSEVNKSFPGGVRGFLQQNGLIQQPQAIMSSWNVVAYGEPVPIQGDEAALGHGNNLNFNHSEYHPDNYRICPNCGMDHADPSGVCPNCGKSDAEADAEAQGYGNAGSMVLGPNGFNFESSWRVVAEDGNTDLGGPEPKMDKAHKFPSPKDVLGDEDKGTWPTKHKDVTEVIERKNRSEEGHEPKEIGEKNTEHVDLPAAKGDDSGFADGGVTKQDGPGTWHGNDGQVDPVTHEKQAAGPHYDQQQYPIQDPLAREQSLAQNICPDCGYNVEHCHCNPEDQEPRPGFPSGHMI